MNAQEATPAVHLQMELAVILLDLTVVHAAWDTMEME